MSGEVFVMRTGGGVKHKYGFWRVNFPAGSSCTLTNGTRTYKAPDDAVSLGRYTFPIPESGSWTVSCTDGTHTASKTNSFSNQYSYYVTTLAYELVLFDSGSYATETGGWSKSGSTLSASVTTTSMDGATDNVYTKNKISVSGYSTLHFQIKSTSMDANGNRRVGLSSKTSGADFSFYADVTGTGEVKIPISSATTSLYVRMYVQAYSSENGSTATTSMVVSKVWLT